MTQVKVIPAAELPEFRNAILEARLIEWEATATGQHLALQDARDVIQGLIKRVGIDTLDDEFKAKVVALSDTMYTAIETNVGREVLTRLQQAEQQRDALQEMLERIMAPLQNGTPIGAWCIANGASVCFPQQAEDGLWEDRELLLSDNRVLVIALPERQEEATGLKTILPMPGYCRVCGCSEHNACIDDNEQPCGWASQGDPMGDLCTACLHGKQP